MTVVTRQLDAGGRHGMATPAARCAPHDMRAGRRGPRPPLPVWATARPRVPGCRPGDRVAAVRCLPRPPIVATAPSLWAGTNGSLVG